MQDYVLLYKPLSPTQFQHKRPHSSKFNRPLLPKPIVVKSETVVGEKTIDNAIFELKTAKRMKKNTSSKVVLATSNDVNKSQTGVALTDQT